MGEAVQQSAGDALVAHHLRPLLEGQVGGHHKAGALVGTGGHLEEKSGAHLREGYIAPPVQYQEILAFQLPVDALQRLPFPTLEQLGHQGGDGFDGRPAFQPI